MSSEIVPQAGGQVDFTEESSFTDPARFVVHSRHLRVVRNRMQTLHDAGVEVPPPNELAWASGRNPEDWVNGAPNDEERELRYQLVDAIEEVARIEAIEREARARAKEVDPEEVMREARRVVTRRRGELLATDWEASKIAGEWFGESGGDFDPDEPEPTPCVLRVDTNRYAFSAGVRFVYGARGSLKSWLTYAAVVEEVKRGNPVLIIDYEMSKKEAMRRLHTLGLSLDQLASENLVYVHPRAISDAARGQLVARFGDRQPSLVVIDSGGVSIGVEGLNANDDSDVAQWGNSMPLWMKAQWPNAVILVIDHVPKNSISAENPIGSQRKGAMADGLYEVVVLDPVSRTKRGGGRVTVRKDRGGFIEEGTAVLDFTFGAGGPFLVKPVDTKTVPMPPGFPDALDDAERCRGVVLDRLRQAGAAGVTSTELTGSGREGRGMRAARDILEKEGLIVSKPDGRSQRWFLAEHV